VAPSPSLILLTGWSLQPTVLIGILALAGAYLYSIGPLRVRMGWGESPSRGRQIAFFTGLAILALALLSPLDTLGDTYLFSAHMVQHMLLTMAVPPLLLLGTPGGLLRPLLRWPAVRRVLRGLTFPLVAIVLFNADFWVWHLPALYNLTLENQALHVIEHLTFLVAATLNWFPVLSPVPEDLPRLPRLMQVLYLFLNCQPMVMLGALLTFAAVPLYEPYVRAPHIFGLSAASDQQLGGLIMWIPGNFVYILVMSIVFFQWVEHQSDTQDAAEQGAVEALAALGIDAASDHEQAEVGSLASGELK
jgi:putative membrane protein